MHVITFFSSSKTNQGCSVCHFCRKFPVRTIVFILRFFFCFSSSLCPPNKVWETYCVCSVSYYSYYYSSSFFLSFFLSFFCHFFRQKFVWHISRRCLDQTLWNLVGISYAMWSCAFKGWFFQNGCRCHGNGQNAKKNDYSRLLAKQKLMKLDRNNIHIWWNEISLKNRNRWDKLCCSCHGNKKGGI